ncbi:MAG: flagellar hook-basal body complex protein [Armatimonadetes bacterium]|nr:flagellar hook-basal body complex protein [Armatimonadota bacterium]
MQSALSSAVSGLTALQLALDVVGGNLANANTPGFKANVITFKDAIGRVLRQPSGATSNTGSTNAQQIGEGVGIGSLTSRYTQGGMQATGKQTDMAITGDGFFVISQVDKTKGYTRNGNFSLDLNGTLTTQDGLEVQGWAATAGVIDTTKDVGKLTVPLGSLTLAKATENSAYSGNLDATASAAGTTTARITGSLDSSLGAGSSVNGTSSAWLDRTGASHTMSYTFTKVTDNVGDDDVWNVTVNGISASGAWTGGSTNTSNVPITFDALGAVATVNGTPGTTLDVIVNDGTPTGQAVTVDFANLLSGAATAVTANSNGSSTDTSVVSSAQVFDSLGIGHTVDITFTKIPNTVTGASGTWYWSTTVDGSSNASDGVLVFNSDGVFDAANSSGSTINFTPTTGAAAVSIDVDFTKITQLATTTADTVIQRSQDGKAPGVLQSFNVDADGTINGTFSNGLGSKLGRLAVGVFQNNEGLLRGVNGLLFESAASGKAKIQAPGQTNGQGALGVISAGTLENSNVDIGTEFTNMIVAQRSFQANAKMVSVVDQVLDELANLKR